MRSRIRSVIVALSVAITAGGVAACGQSGQSDQGASPPAAPEVIRLGALLPITGDNAPSAERIIPAFNLAIKEANDAGGVLGHRIEILTSDDACDPQTAVTEANAMVLKDITVSVGGYCSSATAPTLKIFRKAGIPMIIPGANSTDLVAPGYDSVFLLAGTTAIEAQRAVKWIHELGAHQVVVVHDGTSFSETVAKATADATRRPGSKVTLARELELSQGADSYTRIADQIMASGGDIVFYTGYYAEGGKLIRDLREAGYRGKILLSDGGTDAALFDEVRPEQAEGVYGISLPTPQFEPGHDAWSAKYREIAGHAPGPFTMQGYDAVRLALDAIRRAGTLDRAAVRQALADTRPDDVQLLSGTARFNTDGTQEDPRFILLRAQGDTFVLDPLTKQ